MEITLNNRGEKYDSDQLSVEEIIQRKNFTFKLLVTKINGRLIKKEERSSAMVQDGDNLIVLHLISGG
ncbi:MAG: sulfur carrier protein ThiS [Bacteroidales bacterium]|nr:sulfur carrier protein ThiS [Bacteroidales bacterium]